MRNVRRDAEWQPGLLSPAGRWPALRKRQAPGQHGDLGGFARAGGGDVSLVAGSLTQRAGVAEVARRRPSPLPGPTQRTAYREKTGDGGDAGTGVAFSIQQSAIKQLPK